MDKIARRILVTGVVQGVGFRPFVYNLAQRLELNGWVLNHSGGVDIEVEGPANQVRAFITALQSEAPPLALITGVTATPIAPSGYQAFEIRHSQKQPGQYMLLSPDVATCDPCRRELLDPADRRYRYPFINCTNCGPRFTIIRDVPYDRPNTTMSVFPLCAPCAAEYGDPADRRFHAQPNACPDCGPHLWLVEHREGAAPGELHGDERVLERAKAILLAGEILAVKGLGGFLLACDATNDRAVQLLRERKHRPHKPFAIMAASLEEARALCLVSPEETKLLASPQSPIVLLQRRPETAVSPAVAPNTHTLGVMLPYTPLHHLLLHDTGRPLVMTSGNLSEEPIAKDNDEALRRLADLADAFILHNRDIYARYDDSVMQVIEMVSGGDSAGPDGPSAAGRRVQVQPVRRARGYAPLPVSLPFSLPQIFAAGPLLKNTFTLTRDRNAFVSQHIGDLESVETLEHYEESLAIYQHLFHLQPEWVAADMHPDYLSTRLARQFARQHGLPEPVLVQHHQAHIASCLVDNGWALEDGPVIGVALDGTGYGEDGAIWGGEWFVGDVRGFERAAHLEYLPLPGGDAAIRHPWRTAAAYVHALLPVCDYPAGVFCSADAMLVREQVTRRINTPLNSSMGRLFDAVSALLGICENATYEAQAAIELQFAAEAFWLASAGPDDALLPYPFEIDTSAPLKQLRVAPLLDALLADMEDGSPVECMAARFHLTVSEMILRLCRLLGTETGIRTVALSGGVFQNALLVRTVVPRLEALGLRTLLHRQVPCNDGGVSLGQAAMAGLAVQA
ncbi:MAG: carbamoyltransferase HypF [Anaerolineae bacterium]|nr:carbamoyltransferase HypF [Anaerolineae bacterium]